MNYFNKRRFGFYLIYYQFCMTKIDYGYVETEHILLKFRHHIKSVKV